MVNVTIPRHSMYGIFTYIYPKNDPNVGKYSIGGASGIYSSTMDPMGREYGEPMRRDVAGTFFSRTYGRNTMGDSTM